MIKYYSNRDLARRFDLNLARWKRWSREFLPPDALGGFQSGYARLYSRDDAFTVFLGGYLVRELKFSIPEAKHILSDLSSWFLQEGFYENGSERTETTGFSHFVESFQIFIQPQTFRDARIEFSYTIRGIVSDSPVTLRGHPGRQLLFVEKTLPESRDPIADPPERIKVLNLTDVFRVFCRRIDSDSTRTNGLSDNE